MRKNKCNQIQIKWTGKSVKIWIYGQALINHDNMISGHTIHIKCFPLLYYMTFWSPLFKFHYIYFIGLLNPKSCCIICMHVDYIILHKLHVYHMFPFLLLIPGDLRSTNLKMYVFISFLSSKYDMKWTEDIESICS